jgi:uncharacterized cupredoxin-like copper-binding protein
VRSVRTSAALLALLVTLAITACGEDRETGTGASTTKTGTETSAAPAGKPVKTIQIEESEFKLSPDKVSVDKPGVYEFRAKNVGQTIHALEVEGQGTEVETKEIQPGKTATVKAELKNGEYELYCPVSDHKERGMTGSVAVGGKGGGTATSEDKKKDNSSDDAGSYGY